MRFAYADPPYLDCCSYYGHEHNDAGSRSFDGQCWNDLRTHELLIDWLDEEYPDGWMLSCSTTSLRHMLNFAPDDVRVGAWVKPFASFKPGINPGYCWEPVLFKGGHKRTRTEDTVRDFVSANIMLQKGTPGAKPPTFFYWLLDLMGYRAGDEMHDLFVGSGGFGPAIDAYSAHKTGLAL